MVAVGMILLFASLPSIRAILRALGPGDLRCQWRNLQWLILIFAAAYALLGAVQMYAEVAMRDLVVAAILMAGGGFVLAVARLSEITTRDLVRIGVLERDVVRDPLTGAFNRRYLDSRLDEEIGRSRRSGLALSALMIDLDNFKKINDMYGHPVGDQVLRHVSSLILSQVRINDMVVRYGGEEFMVIAPDSGLDDAIHLGKRLLHQLRNHRITLPNGEQIVVTASIGVAALDAEESRSGFLRRADDALYEAKRDGRDRVCIAPPPRTDRLV